MLKSARKTLFLFLELGFDMALPSSLFWEGTEDETLRSWMRSAKDRNTFIYSFIYLLISAMGTSYQPFINKKRSKSSCVFIVLLETVKAEGVVIDDV